MEPKKCRRCRENPRLMGKALCKSCERARLKEKAEKAQERKKLARIKHKERPAALKKKLDTLFSLYIRGRDKGKPCITCGKPWADNFQCGHFISRRHFNTRWDERNASSQCPGCNMFEGGRQYEHGLAVDRKFGAGTADMVLQMSRIPFKQESESIKPLLEYYEEKAKEVPL